MLAKEEILISLKKALDEMGIKDVKISLEHPKIEAHGDYSTNVALVASKILKKNPFDLALELVEKLNSLHSTLPNIDKVEAVKPGFINFWLSKEYLTKELQEAIDKGINFGTQSKTTTKTVVEYSSPNIAKPFTVGHLRSTIIGDAIANLLEAIGWTVYRDNHLGDWGTQFGKQIYAIKEWGNESELDKSDRPIKLLVDLYVKFHEEAEKNPSLEEKGRKWFKKLEDGDIEAKRLWEKCVVWSLKEFKKIYEELGVKFTENNGTGYGESFFEDKMGIVISDLEKKGLLKESEGARLVFFPKDKYPPLMIMKQDGATLYATRDLATDKFRLEKYGKDVVVINEVGAEQSLYFKQLFEVEKLLGWYKEGQRIHIKHGLYRFKDKKMSTRKGNTIWLEDVLAEAEKRAAGLAKDKDLLVAKEVGIGAIKWNDLKKNSEQDIVFDWDEILNMQGNSGPYLQYTFARTQSVLAKTGIDSGQARMTSFWGAERLRNLKPEEVSLLRTLIKFPEVVEEAGKNFAPNILCNYLFDLAQKFNLFYEKHKIIGSENEELRTLLTKVVGQTIKNGLNLLGIQAPEKM
ncbi:MAG: arginine--tRNA ligase [Candidatus Levybacteria bacterium]|nr:arginine--tRNA ligase [Candidatus Levybacteria bacterium]